MPAEQWSWPVVPPSDHALVRSAYTARRSKTGMDGLPYSAWVAAGDEGMKTLGCVRDQLVNDGVAPWNFNCQEMVFVPKKEWEDFQGGVAIKACEGRGLSLKNTDCKIMAGATNHSCAPTISKHCVGAQRGFVQS
eukprot:4592569-Karenia_brevis.AAC.1